MVRLTKIVPGGGNSDGNSKAGSSGAIFISNYINWGAGGAQTGENSVESKNELQYRINIVVDG